MSNEIVQALEVLKNNCKKYEDCIGCELFYDTCGCYLMEVVPEEYGVGEE